MDHNTGDDKEEKDIAANVNVAKEGDLSPRQVDSLKSGVKKGQKVPLQVKTRSRDRLSKSNQYLGRYCFRILGL